MITMLKKRVTKNKKKSVTRVSSKVKNQKVLRRPRKM
jgi:hypothetical protein